jgi:hypothetical protein
MKEHTAYDNNKWMIASLILIAVAVGLICFNLGYKYSTEHNKIVILNNGLEMKKEYMESFANIFQNSKSNIMHLCNLETKKCYYLQK